ncbi:MULTISPECIES: global transcriptional regulator SarA [Staphylococcus]|jgi:MarR family transcriptional regulator|uniref:HTH-type transcriptional regulator SarS n=4 Tax=Staphylococcus TaxID=1279 RepID=A0A2T4NV92_STAXY|nr:MULTISPECIES: global transcriptional regulator SarA [Staphylococcus]MBF0813008.1 winged helix DNA-binding protein [Staphylococcus saprophyticus]MCZ6903125.1 global transcriptional regulator SarA [Rickettsia endosymbiont of Ixodes persulcatus]MDW8543950.1 global transcriptional regulator SarA [Staphylococcus sp. KG4-1]MRF36926.1 winged helix DNA-binding protein [Staphylococcus sp. KY49P]MBM2657907.1 winged helix DNA-binding protein [Staphylococcus pseudoxylosus]
MAITKINDCFELLAMVTYADKLKGIIKKEFSVSFEEFAVLTYISEHESEEYYLKDIINHLNYKQPQVVKAVKNLSQEDYFDKKRNEHDERTVLILVNTKQRKKINELLSRVNDRIKAANDDNEV